MQLFIIRDYETHEPIIYYITDNASRCHDVMSDVEDTYEDDDTQLAKEKFGDSWITAFENECKRRNIYIELVNIIRKYNY